MLELIVFIDILRDLIGRPLLPVSAFLFLFGFLQQARCRPTRYHTLSDSMVP